MTALTKDIQNQPGELVNVLARTLGEGREALDRAAELVRGARHVYIAGIGASWAAGMGPLALFERAGRPAHLVDAAELLHFTAIPEGSVIIALSRSGKSIEIVGLLDRAAAAKARVVGITNAPESPLAKRSDAALLLGAAFDHNVSVTMYSAPALVGGLVAQASLGLLDVSLGRTLAKALDETAKAIPPWQCSFEGSGWFTREGAWYFLARGGSLASAHEARLLWEEAAKAPATALTTGGFRHGPQEIVGPHLRVGLWLDGERRREQDLKLAADLRKHGAQVMLVGQGVSKELADLAVTLPSIPAEWQFVIDAVPAQIAAERLSRLRGVDCDAFRLSSYVVQSEGGL
jgi:glucosamine--fructose-6-phosphate aminotransferase (isomerizing)